MDRPGLGGCETAFGSAHSVGFIMALCDGSVHLMNFTIDPQIHKNLGNRKDGVRKLNTRVSSALSLGGPGSSEVSVIGVGGLDGRTMRLASVLGAPRGMAVDISSVALERTVIEMKD